MTNPLKDLIINYCRENYLDIAKLCNDIEPKLKDVEKPCSYLTKMLETLDPTPYRVTKPILKLQHKLHDILSKKEFEGEVVDLLMIEEVMVHSLLEFPITTDEMEETIEAIANYCEQRNEKRYDIYLSYLLKSKTIKKCNIPLVVLKKQCERIADLIS